jgi:hypothetical protein
MWGELTPSTAPKSACAMAKLIPNLARRRE